MTKKTIKRASSVTSAWVRRPPIKKSDAEEILNEKISDDAWKAVESAFREYGLNEDELDATPANRTREGWEYQKKSVRNALESAMTSIDSIKTKNISFLHEASYSYATDYNSSGARSGNAYELLTEAEKMLFDAFIIIDRANIIETEIPTDTEARRILFRTVKDALEQSGQDCKLSSGYSLDAIPNGASEADLTPFEQLICALEIHIAESPTAASLWMREVSRMK